MSKSLGKDGGIVLNLSSIEETTPIKPTFEPIPFGDAFEIIDYGPFPEGSPWNIQRPGGFKDHGV